MIFFIATYKLMITDSVTTPVISKGRGRSEHSVMLRIVMKF